MTAAVLLLLLSTACAQESTEATSEAAQAATGAEPTPEPTDSPAPAPDASDGAEAATAEPGRTGSIKADPEVVNAVSLEQRLDTQMQRVDALIEAMQRLAEDQPQEPE